MGLTAIHIFGKSGSCFQADLRIGSEKQLSLPMAKKDSTPSPAFHGYTTPAIF
jgi:hypothetical protein